MPAYNCCHNKAYSYHCIPPMTVMSRSTLDRDLCCLVSIPLNVSMISYHSIAGVDGALTYCQFQVGKYCDFAEMSVISRIGCTYLTAQDE